MPVSILGLVNIVLISPIILGRDLHLISSFQTRNIGTPTCQATKTVPMPAVFNRVVRNAPLIFWLDA